MSVVSVSGKLKALDRDDDLRRCYVSIEGNERDITDLIVAVVEAAERAERKLWHEYRRVGENHQVSLDDLPEDEESWAEGEDLAATLANLNEALT